MKIEYRATFLALSALLTIPAYGATMTPLAKRDVMALRLVQIACRNWKPGQPFTTRAATAAQSQALSGAGAAAASFNCMHNYIGELNWATRGASLHDPLSEWLLGGMYNSGVPGASVAADPAKAFAYFMRSARQGFPEGLMAAGIALLRGQGAAPNPKRGAALVLRAAQEGLPLAMRITGVLYMHGVGVPPDRQRAIFWIERAAAAGDPQARQWLATQHVSPTAAGSPSGSAVSPPQPSAQTQAAVASAPVVQTPVDHQQELRELQQFWTLYFQASHARVVDFGAPALVQPVGFGGAP